METDTYYIERCLDGHPDEFRNLVRRYQPVLLAHLGDSSHSEPPPKEISHEEPHSQIVGGHDLRDRLFYPSVSRPPSRDVGWDPAEDRTDLGLCLQDAYRHSRRCTGKQDQPGNRAGIPRVRHPHRSGHNRRAKRRGIAAPDVLPAPREGLCHDRLRSEGVWSCRV